MAHVGMINWQRFIDGDTFPLIVFLVGGAFVMIVSVLAVQWRRVRVAETEGAIKMQMIEKGYAADEIERVVQSAPRRKLDRRHRCGDFVRAYACG